MKEYLKEITLIIVSFKSEHKINKIIDKISKKINIIIVENSKEKTIKEKLKKYKNIKIYYVNNIGYGSSINYAVRRIKTEYFCVIQPDVQGIDTSSLRLFYLYSKKLNNRYSVIGPHFINATYRGHFQTNIKHDIKKIHNVHGSVMFFNKKIFNKLKGFDKNIFLYWEETDYTKRAKKWNFYPYQLNLVKVKHEKGKAVKTLNTLEKEKLINLYSWHFTWSKFYYYKKHYSLLIALISSIPLIFRTLFKINYYLNKDKKKSFKYQIRWKALKSSIKGEKSFLRLKNI